MPKLLRQEAGGVGQYFDGPVDDGVLTREVYASTCSHCTAITEFASRRAMMEYVEVCRGCMKLICLDCAGKPCRPFEKEAERQEREARLRRRIEAAGWRCY